MKQSPSQSKQNRVGQKNYSEEKHEEQKSEKSELNLAKSDGSEHQSGNNFTFTKLFIASWKL